MKKAKYAVFDKRQSAIGKFLSNACTLFLLALCAWISQDSKWWTFVTGLFFLFWLFLVASKAFVERNNEFETKADLQRWVDGLED